MANTGSTTETVTFSHERTTAGIVVTTEIAKDFPIPANDTATFLDGKFSSLESNDVLVISGSSGDLKFLGSVLETLK